MSNSKAKMTRQKVCFEFSIELSDIEVYSVLENVDPIVSFEIAEFKFSNS